MKNPWTKKNPFLSMWLSGANSIAGSARGQASAQMKRQTKSIMNEGAKQMAEVWTSALVPPAPTKTKAKKRR